MVMIQFQRLQFALSQCKLQKEKNMVISRIPLKNVKIMENKKMNLIIKQFNLLCALTICFLLVGCGSTKTMVLEPVERQNTVKKLRIEKDNNTTTVDASVEKYFEENLRAKLFKEYGFQEGSDIVIKYRFIQLNEGSRFGRWMLGGLGNCGEGSTTIEVKFIDNTQNAKEIGKIHTEGKIGSGFLGGDMDNAVKGAAEEIANYAKSTFKSN